MKKITNPRMSAKDKKYINMLVYLYNIPAALVCEYYHLSRINEKPIRRNEKMKIKFFSPIHAKVNNYEVNLEKKSCSCMWWSIKQKECKHLRFIHEILGVKKWN